MIPPGNGKYALSPFSSPTPLSFPCTLLRESTKETKKLKILGHTWPREEEEGRGESDLEHAKGDATDGKWMDEVALRHASDFKINTPHSLSSLLSGENIPRN